MKPDFLIEVSWEVCNKIGGIYTVVSTKARNIKEKYNDNYILIGPDVWRDAEDNQDFIEDHELLKEWKLLAWEKGLKVRVGRWNIESNPIVILVDYTPYFGQKDEIFARFWEDFHLDSLSGQWDYVEPAMFGYAAGRVIEHFSEYQYVKGHQVAAHFHEWMTGTGVLYLKKNTPMVATSFTTHATVLGRTISGNGLPLYENLKSYNAYQIAQRFNVISKNSLETLAAVEADAYTTVSSITAMECKQFYGKQPDVITINGFDESFVPSGKDYSTKRLTARKKAIEIASKLTGKKFDDDVFLVINSGRYEFRNKGIDLFIRSLGQINKSNDVKKDIIAFITVPANFSEINKVFTRGEKAEGINKLLTHYIWDSHNDPVLNEALRNGLNNDEGNKVTLIFMPVYLNGKDGVANLSYYDFLIGFDYSVFPSYYEPWGYTPMESIAFKIPTVTTSFAGFGAWILENVKVENKAVTVINREEGKDAEAVSEITKSISDYINIADAKKASEEAATITRELLWDKLVDLYFETFELATKKALKRVEKLKPSYRPKTRQVEVSLQKDKPHWKKIMINPYLPEELLPLKELAHNLWWSWDTEATKMFASLLPDKWEKFEYNPVRVLEELSSDDHNRLVNDKVFMARLKSVCARFQEYMKAGEKKDDLRVAYFSMEYGLHVSVKIYSGGLGILAGDYLKQASDSNKNLFAVGLLYRYGYFNQKITFSGDQVAESLPQKFTQLPLKPVRNEKGDWVTVSISLPGRNVYAKAWRLDVGRVPLYLLDTDVEENSQEDRALTHHLYGGDREHRLKQEMLLGLGGIRLIDTINEKPDIYHSNEGHSAFIGLERVRALMAKNNIGFDTAKELVRATTLFTTHTPVPAGHDTFEEHLIRAYLSHFPQIFNISWERFIGLGRFNPYDPNEEFSMSVLATNLSQEVNGVSRIHGKVSRDMFQRLYPGYYSDELHIGYVTNGVHYFTWTDDLWQEKYRGFFGEEFENDQPNEEYWQNIYNVPDIEIWKYRMSVKREMIKKIKVKLKKDLTYRQENPKLIIKSLSALNENTLIIGFARRFATYKRAHLLFTNLERLEKIVNHEKRPVIFIFAGKAHPADKAGQDLIKRIVEISKMPQFAGKILFVENYDMTIGKLLTNGVDVWLNTPTRPLEASGTSGEKAIMNGVLNFSVLDGWWAEGYKPGAGWAIEENKTYLNQQLQDELDAEIIYDTFESEITPAYYHRNRDDVPEAWISHVKNTIALITPHFTMQRMVNDYYRLFYSSLKERKELFFADNFKNAEELARWKKKILENWDNISVDKLIIPDSDKEPINFGELFVAEVSLNIPGLTADDIGVEIVLGNLSNDDIDKIKYKQELEPVEYKDGHVKYTIEFPIRHPGVYDFAFRVFPKHKLLKYRMDFPLVKWI
jgi:phosphorylase/glycogen(starch) synthase